MQGAAVLIIFFVLLLIAAVVLMIVAWCKLFRKAGYHPGKFFIPVYGSYLCYRIADASGLFFAQLAVSIAGSVISSIISGVVSARSYSSYYYSDISGSLSAMAVVIVIECIALLIINIFYCIKLARAFGKSGGFAVGLMFLYPVFICILGFGNAEYCGSCSYNYRGITATGTWICPSCGAENPISRATCRCGQVR